MHILHVVGARPNFMKVAPVLRALAHRQNVRQTLVHTGQHYDRNMSEIFFDELDIPRPDVCLEVGSGSHAVQTAQILLRFEATVLERRPDFVLVYGDVNSTVGAALVCAKLQIPVGHVEAGLRSFDRSMPEEINRVLTDQLADVLFTPSADGDENLIREGINPTRIHRVGNVMIDTLHRLLPKARLPKIDGLESRYALVTLHRPSNVDEPESLARIVSTLSDISDRCQVVFPVHPRTRQRLASLDVAICGPRRLLLLEPLGYLEFLALERDATLIITDSGGVQEESTCLGIPCLTLRENTERPVTVDVGTNVLIGADMGKLESQVDQILSGIIKPHRVPEMWDGNAAERIAGALCGDAGPVDIPSRRAA